MIVDRMLTELIEPSILRMPILYIKSNPAPHVKLLCLVIEMHV